MGMHTFNMALDALMIIAIIGLWVMWFKQSYQRKKVEKMLSQASQELQEATKLLEQVMMSLEQQQEATQSKKKALFTPTIARSVEDKVDIEHHMPQKAAASGLGKVAATDGQGYSAQIMRLAREGLSEAMIAEEINVPIAQVRLMLLLQKPKA